jgi:hypothetical protein
MLQKDQDKGVNGLRLSQHITKRQIQKENSWNAVKRYVIHLMVTHKPYTQKDAAEDFMIRPGTVAKHFAVFRDKWNNGEITREDVEGWARQDLNIKGEM